jgi:hypothetical protein
MLIQYQCFFTHPFVGAGDQDYDFLEGGLGAAFFNDRMARIRAAFSKAGATLAHPQQQQQQQQQPPASSLEQRAALLGERPLPGTAKPAPHTAAGTAGVQQAVLAGQAPPEQPESRDELLKRAAAAGILGAGGDLKSRFVSSAKLAPQAGGVTAGGAAGGEAAQPAAVSAAAGEPVRTQRDWVPEPLLCRRFNVPDPNQGKSAKQASTGPDYLAAPPEQRAAMYTANLPASMRPPAERADGPNLQALPPPPPWMSSNAAQPPSTAKKSTDVFVEELLAAAEAGDTQVGAGAPDMAASVIADADVPVEKPMDIFKAIFENSDYEASASDDGSPDPENAQVQSAVAGSATSAADPSQAGPAQRRAGPSARGAADSQAPQLPSLAALHPDTGGASGVNASAAAPTRTGEDSPQRLAFKRRRQSSSLPLDRHAASPSDLSPEQASSGGISPRLERHRDHTSSRDRREKRSKKRRHNEEKREQKHKRERREREDALVQQALDTVQRGVLQQGVSTEELAEMAQALKKRSRRQAREGASTRDQPGDAAQPLEQRASHSDSSGDESDRSVPHDSGARRNNHKSKSKKSKHKRSKHDC